MVAGILYYLGVDMGEPFIRPDKNNESGYFESVEIIDINERFTKNRISYRDFDIELKEIIEKKKEPWGIKDPRLSELIPYYAKHLENPKFIRCRRDHQATINSLMKAYSFDQDGAMELINKREGEMDEWLGGLDILELDYEDRYNAIDKICEFTGLEKTQEAVDFVL